MSGIGATLAHDTSLPIRRQFRSILLATDFSVASLQALPYATFLARKYDSTLYLAHIVSPGMHGAIPEEMLSISMDAAAKEAEQQMHSLEGSEKLRGISHKTLLGSGDISEYILNAVREHHIGLVILGTHGRTGIKRLMLGSVAEEIFRVAPCPVLTVGANAQSSSTVSRILFPTDLSSTSRCAVPFAASLADETGAELVVLHVLPPTIAPNPDAELLSNPLREEAERILDGHLHPGTRFATMFECGAVAETIVHQAKMLNAGFIVMGVRHSFTTHGFANVAYSVATSAPCPVLTVRDPIYGNDRPVHSSEGLHTPGSWFWSCDASHRYCGFTGF